MKYYYLLVNKETGDVVYSSFNKEHIDIFLGTCKDPYMFEVQRQQIND